LTAPISPPPPDSAYRPFARIYGQWHIKVSLSSLILQVDRLQSRQIISTNAPALQTEPSCPELRRRDALCSDTRQSALVKSGDASAEAGGRRRLQQAHLVKSGPIALSSV
jgi:hypothetical protein